ncbi:hypothetical protein MMC06_000124 [Schaereria dolodes]|nr:hypothetical protein [Schaereria dolodes]
MELQTSTPPPKRKMTDPALSKKVTQRRRPMSAHKTAGLVEGYWRYFLAGQHSDHGQSHPYERLDKLPQSGRYHPHTVMGRMHRMQLATDRRSSLLQAGDVTQSIRISSPPSRRNPKTLSPSSTSQQQGITTTSTPVRLEASFTVPPPVSSTPASRKRKAPGTIPTVQTATTSSSGYGDPGGTAQEGEIVAESSSPTTVKKSRTNTPWSPAEEQRLKSMRDAGNSWSEIAKTFPTRTEGSVKKHWYKDMHYADFAADESAALLAAIKEYEASKWKVIGQKVGKPAKACEQYAKEHFGNRP